MLVRGRTDRQTERERDRKGERVRSIMTVDYV